MNFILLKVNCWVLKAENIKSFYTYIWLNFRKAFHFLLLNLCGELFSRDLHDFTILSVKKHFIFINHKKQVEHERIIYNKSKGKLHKFMLNCCIYVANVLLHFTLKKVCKGNYRNLFWMFFFIQIKHHVTVYFYENTVSDINVNVLKSERKS